MLESNKDNLKLETYSLSQTTLEQVFLSFAREQKDELEIIAQAEAERERELFYQERELEPVQEEE